MVNMRLLDVDSNASLRGATLRRAIEEDLKNGKIPIYVKADFELVIKPFKMFLTILLRMI